MEKESCEPFGWDMVFLRYILSISFTAMSFGGSRDGNFSPILLCCGFWHFGFEYSQSIYFTYAGRSAVYVSRVVVAICLLESVLAWPFASSMSFIFSLQFMTSDVFSFLSSVCLLLNKSLPRRFKVLTYIIHVKSSVL